MTKGAEEEEEYQKNSTIESRRKKNKKNTRIFSKTICGLPKKEEEEMGQTINHQTHGSNGNILEEIILKICSSFPLFFPYRQP